MQTTDGAAAVMLMKRSEAERRGLPIMATLKSFAAVGVPPSVMGIGPAVAVPAALEKAGLSKDDIDIYELNEAFASQVCGCASARFPVHLPCVYSLVVLVSSAAVFPVPAA